MRFSLIFWFERPRKHCRNFCKFSKENFLPHLRSADPNSSKKLRMMGMWLVDMMRMILRWLAKLQFKNLHRKDLKFTICSNSTSRKDYQKILGLMRLYTTSQYLRHRKFISDLVEVDKAARLLLEEEITKSSKKKTKVYPRTSKLAYSRKEQARLQI